MSESPVETTPDQEPDLVDRLLRYVDHGLDVVHDKVLRPVIMAARAAAFGLIIVLCALVFVAVAVIGLVRFFDVYVFNGRVWLTYGSIGAASVLAGALVWRKRRPLKLRK